MSELVKHTINVKQKNLRQRGHERIANILQGPLNEIEWNPIPASQAINDTLRQNPIIKLHRNPIMFCLQMLVCAAQTLSVVGLVAGVISCMMGKTSVTSGRYLMFPPTATETMLRDLESRSALLPNA